MPKRTRKTSKKQQARQDARPFAHRTGRWAKKCRGKFIYLGSIADDPSGEQAWLKWLGIRDDVRAGRTPRPKVEGLTVRDLANHWLTSKQALLDSGELAGRTMVNYKSLTDLIVPVLGPDRLVEDLVPEDFRKLRSAMAKRWGPVRMNITITYVRGIFNHALENRLIERPVWFGTEFERPSAKTLPDLCAARCAADRRQAVRAPSAVFVRIAARPWMPDAFAFRLIHPLCLPNRDRCVPVHLALPLRSRVAGPDWGTVVASPCQGNLSHGLTYRQTGCFPTASFTEVPPERFR